MAEIWDYIAQYNPTGFYEDNRAKTLRNDYMNTQISAAEKANEREAKIMALEDAWANGDAEALRKLGIYAPEKRSKMIDNEEKMLEIMRPVAQSVMQTAPENREKAYQQLVQFGKSHGIDMSDVPFSFDENFVSTLANSDAQKLRDERLNEMTKERDTIEYNRSLAKLQYQNALATRQAEAERQRKLNFLDSIKAQMSPEDYQAQVAAINGVSYTPPTPLESMTRAFLSGDMSPEQGQEFLNRVNSLKQAQSGKTPDNAKALYNISKMDASPEEKSKIARDLGLGEYDFNQPIKEVEIAKILMQQYPDLTEEQALSLAFKNKGTTVNVNNGEGTTAFEKEMGKKDADTIAGIEKDIVEIENQMPLLEQMSAAVSDPNLYQGTGGDALNKLKVAYASAMRASGNTEEEIEKKVRGLDSASILNTGSAMLKGRLRKDLMPGPLSDRDLQFLINMSPSLDKTSAQNAAIINMYKKMYQRQNEIMSFMSNYARTHKSLDSWKEAAKQAGLGNSVFTDEEKKFVKMSKAEASKTPIRQERSTNPFAQASDEEILGVLGGF